MVVKYGITKDDTWNFDETGYRMGIARSDWVVTVDSEAGGDVGRLWANTPARRGEREKGQLRERDKDELALLTSCGPPKLFLRASIFTRYPRRLLLQSKLRNNTYGKRSP